MTQSEYKALRLRCIREGWVRPDPGDKVECDAAKEARDA